MNRKTKIIATIGPASLKKNVLRGIIKEGADYIRINTFYSNQKQHLIVKEALSDFKKVKVIFDIINQEKLKNIVKPELIAFSFAESAQQIKRIKKDYPLAKVIAKIESKKGVANFQEIMNFSDGVMIARGDLGRAVSLEKVPCIQKKFSLELLKSDKFLIIATEMLLSMTKNKVPTRAEVSDVANAVFEQASAVMLSEETAIGKHPVEAVKWMRRIIQETEKCVYVHRRSNNKS